MSVIPLHPDRERRNQCAECTNWHDNHNMICDYCYTHKGYGDFSDEPGYKPYPGDRQ